MWTQLPVATVLCGVAMAATASAQPVTHEIEQPSIRVSGTGEVQARPDMVQLNVGVVTQADSAATAVEQNNQAMGQLMDTLDEFDIPERDIQTTSFSVSPQYDRGPQREAPPKIAGYQVANQVQVKIRKVDRLGEILDKVVTAGANRVQGIAFTFQDPTELEDRARQKAMADARRKARLLAEAADAELGGVLVIQEQSSGGPQPLYGRQMAVEAARAVPVSPGEEAVTAEVSVVYGLLQIERQQQTGGTARERSTRR